MNEMSYIFEDYEALEDALLAAGTHLTPAHIHGKMMGFLCIGSCSTQMSWQALVLDMPFLDGEHKIIHGLFRSLYTKAVTELHDLEGSLQLVLPIDESSIAQRLEAMVYWCEGFMQGIKLASLQNKELLELPTVKEILSDLAHIQEVSLEELDSEENEKAYTEIVEFVRVGVLLVHAECGLKPKRSEDTLNQTVH